MGAGTELLQECLREKCMARKNSGKASRQSLGKGFATKLTVLLERGPKAGFPLDFHCSIPLQSWSPPCWHLDPEIPTSGGANKSLMFHSIVPRKKGFNGLPNLPRMECSILEPGYSWIFAWSTWRGSQLGMCARGSWKKPWAGSLWLKSSFFSLSGSRDQSRCCDAHSSPRDTGFVVAVGIPDGKVRISWSRGWECHSQLRDVELLSSAFPRCFFLGYHCSRVLSWKFGILAAPKSHGWVFPSGFASGFPS